MSTPEGLTKAAIKALLLDYKIYPASKAGAFPEDAEGWAYMPVGGQGGVSGIPDFVGAYRGRFWAIEAKAPGKRPSGFQLLQIQAIQKSGAACFVVDGEESLKEFEEWLVAERRDLK